MSDKPEKRKWPRKFALDVTRDVLTWLRPLCTKIVVAGSLRRGKGEVGDIEFLYIPRLIYVPDESDLFANTKRGSAVDVELEKRLATGELTRRLKSTGAISAWGPDMKHAVHEWSGGMPIDFFTATVETWACNLVCRTGGAASNTELATRSRERGWMWHPTGVGFERISGPDRGRVEVMKSEREIFEFAGLPYREPRDRN